MTFLEEKNRHRKKYTILVTTHDHLSPIYGGGALRTIKVAKEFQNRGHRVIILGVSDKSEIEGIVVHPLPAPLRHRSRLRSTLIYGIVLFLKTLFLINKVDVFFAHNAIVGPFTFPLSRIFRKKYIFDVTDIHGEYLRVCDKDFLEKIVTPFIVFFEILMLKLSDKVIVVTNAMRDFLIKRGVKAEKISVVYDGAEVDNFTPLQKREKGQTIIHLGSVDRQDGVHLLVGAAPFVLKKYPGAKFYMVGDGRELLRVKKLAIELGVHNSFVFTGYLPYQKVREYLEKSSIGISPRPDLLPNNLVTTLQILEYWASGIAVISSHLKGIAEISHNNEDILFFRPGDCKDLAEKIIYLLDNPKRIEELGSEGIKNVSRFDWKNLIPKIADICLENL